jgi:hypothetical protein
MFSKLFCFIGLVAFLACAAAPVPVTSQLYGKNYISNANSFDSLVSSTDSATLISGWVPEDGWEYFIAYGPSSGACGDTAKHRFEIQCFSPSGVYLYTKACDTVQASLGGVVTLPVGTSAVGFSYTVKVRAAVKWAKTYLNRFYLGKRK